MDISTFLICESIFIALSWNAVHLDSLESLLTRLFEKDKNKWEFTSFSGYLLKFAASMFLMNASFIILLFISYLIYD